jgi:hypothetical protein
MHGAELNVILHTFMCQFTAQRPVELKKRKEEKNRQTKNSQTKKKYKTRQFIQCKQQELFQWHNSLLFGCKYIYVTC